MRKRLAMALPTAALLVGASALPAVAATNSGPSTQADAQPTGHAIGNAGGTIASLTVGGSTVPGHLLGENAILSGSIAHSSAKTTSETDNENDHSTAEAGPLAFSALGNDPQVIGGVSQSALPDHANPATSGVEIPDNPLIQGKILPSSAQARYSAKLGPCVKPLADSSTSIASLYIGNLDTGLGNNFNITGNNFDVSNVLSQNAMSKLGLQEGDNLSQLPELQNTLNSILDFGNNGSDNTPDFSLLALPKTVHSHSTVKLVDMKGSDNKAVQSTSKIQLADITLFKGAPGIETHIKIVSEPKLTVTSTGDKDSSSISYDAPVFKITQGGKQIGPTYNLANDANGQAEVPVNLLPLSGTQVTDILGSKDGALHSVKSLLENMNLSGSQKQSSNPVATLPIIGDSNVVGMLDKAGISGISESNVLDLGVLKIGLGSLSKQGQEKSSPFDGYQLGATSNIFDLQVLPSLGGNGLLSTDFLNNVSDSSSNGSSALLDVAFGKQTAKAYAPEGGVDCSAPEKPAPAAPASNPTPPQQQPLAYTGAYDTVPLFWTGTGLVLGGGVLLVGFAARRKRLAKGSAKGSE